MLDYGNGARAIHRYHDARYLSEPLSNEPGNDIGIALIGQQADDFYRGLVHSTDGIVGP